MATLGKHGRHFDGTNNFSHNAENRMATSKIKAVAQAPINMLVLPQSTAENDVYKAIARKVLDYGRDIPTTICVHWENVDYLVGVGVYTGSGITLFIARSNYLGLVVVNTADFSIRQRRRVQISDY